MDLPLLECSVREARAKVADYRKIVKAKKASAVAEYDAADRALLNAYREILRGERVLDIYEVFAAHGLDSDNMPKLAIARADAKYCRMNRTRTKTRFISAEHRSGWLGSRIAKSKKFDIPAATMPTLDDNGYAFESGVAVVPTVPPDVRAEHPNLSAHAILWEAEWEELPYDPILLKPLGHNLYKVVAQWDLTEIERSILFDMRP